MNENHYIRWHFQSGFTYFKESYSQKKTLVYKKYDHFIEHILIIKSLMNIQVKTYCKNG